MTTARAVPGWLRVAVLGASAAAVVLSALVVYRSGRWPASVPGDAPDYQPLDLMEALRHLDSRGLVDARALANDRAALDRFVAAMAKTSPRTAPERFPTVEDRVAFWLNAVHALELLVLADAGGAAPAAAAWRSWPIGGERLTREAIAQRFLAEAGDGRVWLARFDGTRGGPRLDSAPFAGDTLDAQLTEAARRFFARPDTVRLAPPVVQLSPHVLDHLDDLLAALPEERAGVLQIVWAFLPEQCEGLRPGCDTRADLDRACGARFDRCTVAPLPRDSAPALTGP